MASAGQRMVVPAALRAEAEEAEEEEEEEEEEEAVGVPHAIATEMESATKAVLPPAATSNAAASL